jgi:hypothetical protein
MQFFYGNIDGIQIIAQDKSGTSTPIVADSTVKAISLSYAPVASGIDKNVLATTPALNLNLGVSNTIYDPQNSSQSIFSHVKEINTSEDLKVSLVFKGVNVNQILVKVGTDTITPTQDNAGNLSFTFTKETMPSIGA